MSPLKASGLPAHATLSIQHHDHDDLSLLDPVSPTQLWPAFRHVFLNLERAGVVDRYRSFERQLLIGLDGTQYFSSLTLHCPQCSQRKLTNGRTQYSQSVVTPVIVQPNNPQVLAVEPALIGPQDGQAKQDCESQPAKRWLRHHGALKRKLAAPRPYGRQRERRTSAMAAGLTDHIWRLEELLSCRQTPLSDLKSPHGLGSQHPKRS